MSDALVTRFLVITDHDDLLAVKYNREAAYKACAEWRAAGKRCGIWSEVSLLRAPQFTQEVCILKFDDPITYIN